jgi:hypothetical protein
LLPKQTREKKRKKEKKERGFSSVDPKWQIILAGCNKRLMKPVKTGLSL